MKKWSRKIRRWIGYDFYEEEQEFEEKGWIKITDKKRAFKHIFQI